MSNKGGLQNPALIISQLNDKPQEASAYIHYDYFKTH